MSSISQHAEWLSLIDVSGPFLAEPVLKSAFPQGLEGVASEKRKKLRQAYEEWREAREQEVPDFLKIHTAWIDLVLREGLEFDEDRQGQIFKSKDELPESLTHTFPEHGVTLSPEFAVVNDQNGDEPLMLVSVFDPDVSLITPVKGDGWAASPAERMVELCRAADVRLGLLSNGEQWMFIDAPVGSVTTFATWEASLWSQEPKTLQAFVNLLGVRRFFVDSSEQLPALLDESLKHQDEVTEALGEQVQRAVEVLIQSLDRANVDRNHELLEGIAPAELYEAALTVMMRIVFLLSAEERGLLLMGDERYEANYAVSTLRTQLRGESEEILERRWDAWSRLLSIFRAVYDGIDHEALRLPALGGSLFDPDRFPFLEGRLKGSNWKSDPATPLPIDNRTVLLLLDAVQLFRGRTLSYRALDVEQIGYVYEGLLERTVVRAKEVTLDLNATKNAKKPWVCLDELETASAIGSDAVSALLKERTGSSASRVANDLAKPVDEADADKLLSACHGDQALRDQIKPYFHFLRIDPWGYPLVYPVGTFMVTTGTDRRETGTHYTPKSLTEVIVKETLVPIAYIGPAEGKPREDWKLKSPSELLDLKICDPAMGSGAFLVQACRWLSERLVEAWSQSEIAGNSVTSDGLVVEKVNGYEPLRGNPEERMLTARRLIAERCLYGVDVNPLAVELAKLSIWLVTLAKGRPFGFLDHNLRSGDSLLGINNLDQLRYLELQPGKGSSKKLFATNIDDAVAEAIDLRKKLRSQPIKDIRDVELMAGLDEKARTKLSVPQLIADVLVGEALTAAGKTVDSTTLSILAGEAIEGQAGKANELSLRSLKLLKTDLPKSNSVRRPFHWPLEFTEVFHRDNAGFDAIVGNPPFMKGHFISRNFGDAYRSALSRLIGDGKSIGLADLVAYFFARSASLLRTSGTFGLLSTNSISSGDTNDFGLQRIIDNGVSIFQATKDISWPGKAGVVVSIVWGCRGKWSGGRRIDGKNVASISPQLTADQVQNVFKLAENKNTAFNGSYILGDGFTLDRELAASWIADDAKNSEVVIEYINGKELFSYPDGLPRKFVICFWDWPQEKAEEYEKPFARAFEKVKPVRDKVNRERRRKLWWIHAENNPGLYHSVGQGDKFERHPTGWEASFPAPSRVICKAKTSKTWAFTFLPRNIIFDQTIVVIADGSYALFAQLQSSLHELWAVRRGSTLKTDMSYTPSSVFETFPFLRSDLGRLEELGREFFEARHEFLLDQGVGLTDFNKMFHDSKERDSRVDHIRNILISIDGQMAASYKWLDIEMEHDFFPQDHLPESDGVRFTLSDGNKSEILDRLTQLNNARHFNRKSDDSIKNSTGERSLQSGAAEDKHEEDLFSSRGFNS